MKIYVGNLGDDVSEEELRKEFGAFGEVASVDIITDKYSGRPKGFGFVEMAKVSEGQAAIAGQQTELGQMQGNQRGRARRVDDNCWSGQSELMRQPGCEHVGHRSDGRRWRQQLTCSYLAESQFVVVAAPSANIHANTLGVRLDGSILDDLLG